MIGRRLAWVLVFASCVADEPKSDDSGGIELADETRPTDVPDCGPGSGCYPPTMTYPDPETYTGDADTDVDTDADTDTDTDAFLRVVDLVTEPSPVDVYLDDVYPFAELTFGGNTDAGSDYTEILSGVPSIRVEHQGVVLSEFDLVATGYHTVVLYGSLLDAWHPPTGGAIEDDVSASVPGMHVLTFVQAAAGDPVVDLYVDGVMLVNGFSYGSHRLGQVVSLTTTLGVDIDRDGTIDRSYAPALADGGWSYVYLVSDPVLGLAALHHVRGAPLSVVPPS